MKTTTDKKEIVIDELAAQYELQDKLGEGGQGTVYSTNFDNVLVKLLNPKLSKSKKTEFNKKIKFLRRLNLENMNVSLPIVSLANEHTGYIMELMDEMIPLENFNAKQVAINGPFSIFFSLLLQHRKSVSPIQLNNILFIMNHYRTI